MVGQGVLYECLHDPDVSDVLVIGRSSLGQRDPKLSELVIPNVGDLSKNESDVTGYDACFFCLGVSSVGMSEADYRKTTYDLTISAATTLARVNPAMTFTYVSGKGTDGTEKGKQMWARVKGATENALLRMPFKAAYMFRPGAIQPMHGEKPRGAGARLLLTILGPLIPLVMRLSPASVTTTERIGRAMLIAAKRDAPKRVLESEDINALAASA